jgi:NTE family protein
MNDQSRIAEDAEFEPCEWALCLSGGGYRAMLFHLGALWRLNELAILSRLDRVSSVSGGSIAAGVLARHWNDLEFGADGVASNFELTVAADLRRLAGKTVDVWAVLRGLLWFGSIGNRVAGSYRRHLFGGRTLADLPEHPRFVFNATNLQSGALWRFSRKYMADYRVGQVVDPDIDLAVAVAASSAFPPFLSPVRLKLREGAVQRFADGEPLPLERKPFTTKVHLSDGGVYDNLGLETALRRCRIVLVSDGGGKLADKKRPWRNWPGHTLRVLGVIDNQVRSLRKRWLLDDFKEGRQEGTFWSIRTDVADYKLGDALPADPARTAELAATRTRLGRLDPERQQRLVNWGYTVSDAALRAYVVTDAPAPQRLPYPEAGI